MKTESFVAVLIVVGFCGCATAKKTYAPDGRPAFTVECSGQALNWGMCFQKAGELCGAKGYDIIVQTGDQGKILTASQFGVVAGTTINRSMVIACKS